MSSKDFFTNLPPREVEPSDPQRIQFELFRSIKFFLDEISSQGLQLLLDEDERYSWHWKDLNYTSPQKFWSLGEAIRDALCFKHPDEFADPDEDPPRFFVPSV